MMTTKLLQWLARALLAVVAVTMVVVLPWRWFNPPTSAFMLRDALQNQQSVEHWWLPLSQISPRLSIAVIAAEDQKFPQHHGFDIDQIKSVLERGGSPGRGASTLSQQVAKNLYLWPGRSYLRKGIEAWLTLWLEMLWPKARILEIYLNIAEFGPGVYGAAAASELLLHTRADELSMHQASLLAAVLPNPKLMSAAQPSDYVEKRSTQIQRAAEQLGGVSYLSNL
jgi:monofunctional biosynthetic peptidoglycan transglycosylase